MSINEKSDLISHWSEDPVISCNFCPNIMSKDRFLNILCMFHLNDNSKQKKKGEEGFDALYKVRPLMDNIINKFQKTYYPEEALTIDEGMYPFRVCVSSKVYMAKKPNKYGIKLYILAEANTGYIWNFEVYHGREQNIENTAASVVKRLVDPLSNKGHTVYVDWFYTSISLAEYLSEVDTGMVGKVMKTRKGLPTALKEAKLKKEEQTFRRKNNILAIRWKDKRDVYMISTRHASSSKERVNMVKT
ncbi:piggyBac transposable element-derived protein 4-like [Centruroides sculpturatus]|uniref:piggyBac transposable element-derived protein 4-like n=1 Tax=Centruroides sculpturatus TaxID=218467 RepID=UPI000C6CA3A2|nr:piggyBac transposable element-derived protein 4-like [Centruroides sculpturatus]